MLKVEDYKPEYIGRGQWYCIHSLAANSKNLEERKHAVWAIQIIVNSIRCSICLEHALQFLETNPIKNKIYDSIELFKWTYEFHEAANKHANKPSVPYEEVRKFYYENHERCSVKKR